jgi:5-hydroxyisourate hydrolase
LNSLTPSPSPKERGRNNYLCDYLIPMSQITTHILDTAIGKPASDVSVLLFEQENGMEDAQDGWREIAIGTTDKDGRVSNLLNKDSILREGIYKLRFETKEYFEKQSCQTFYPFVEITFHISTKEHYHIPLLLNPFGYSTYRGS